MSDNESIIQQDGASSITLEASVAKSYYFADFDPESDGCDASEAIDSNETNWIPIYSNRRETKEIISHFTSLLLFILGSILYIVLAVWDYQYSKELNELPLKLRGVDDDVVWATYQKQEGHGADTEADDDYFSQDDDYIFQVGGYDVWVSEYQMLYFFAAASFLLVGILDVIRENMVFHVLMIIAGMFGVASSFYVEEKAHLSDTLDCLSVHFYLLEAIAMLLFHCRRETDLPENWIAGLKLFADLEFIMGAILDVMFSYFFVYDIDVNWDTTLMSMLVLSNLLWLSCAIIFMGIFIYSNSFC